MNSGTVRPAEDPSAGRRSRQGRRLPPQRTWAALTAVLLVSPGAGVTIPDFATDVEAARRNTAGSLSGQTPPDAWHEALRQHWEVEHRKLLDMAADLPVSLYESRPHPDSRDALDELRHVTVGLEMSTAQLEGREFDYQARVAADASKERSPEAVAAEMQTALNASLAAIDRVGAHPALIWWLSHQSEHYGKLVTIYRMNDRIPPLSRPRG